MVFVDFMLGKLGSEAALGGFDRESVYLFVHDMWVVREQARTDYGIVEM